ncbi:serine/threonine-protein kinase [Paraliomyxa miuraensis]|uniref:serine/threonine-protein kinase n=1 Tax=Paraliomyxa miuraensis TaxID=376150 RepID=UPI002257D9E4|nr:serine/threonine-protein kinase [Paraliomyxa miuraensis]MCX4242218.1 serine/threonine protein kinase [Paraliomyxa miuraensis]
MAGARLPDDHTRPPDEPSMLETTASGDPAVAPRAAVLATPEPGDNLGPYVVEATLGQGAMGVVYKAADDRGQKVAVKLLHRWHTDPETGEDDWLRHEAGTLARLSHPNVVAVLGVGTFDDRPFLAMELVDGETLATWMKQPRPWRDIVPIIRDAARGLAAVHTAGMIHGDFKPDNLMVGRDGRARVMDFGLARSTFGADATAAPTVEVERGGVSRHRFVGTPAYMAPEQLAGRRAEARSDQFACSVTLYEALYGERPFPGQTATELAYNVMRGFRRPRPRTTDVPAWLHQIVHRGLALVGAARWPSMAAYADALERGMQEHADDDA